MRLISALFLLAATPLWAGDERPGEFDYYVLALSWSPTWCTLEGDARNAPQCEDHHDHGFVLHGLWPQFDPGYPSFCASSRRPPTRTMTRAMADIMGSSGAAWHQWKKHGSCSGLSAQEYFTQARHAYDSINRPKVFRAPKTTLQIPASVVQDAFIEANPGLDPDAITITCKFNMIHEARLCLTRDLEPRPCGSDVIRDCTSPDADMSPIR